MTIRELTCLVRLFQACADPALRRRAMELVPELSEWDTYKYTPHDPTSEEWSEAIIRMTPRKAIKVIE